MVDLLILLPPKLNDLLLILLQNKHICVYQKSHKSQTCPVQCTLKIPSITGVQTGTKQVFRYSKEE